MKRKVITNVLSGVLGAGVFLLLFYWVARQILVRNPIPGKVTRTAAHVYALECGLNMVATTSEAPPLKTNESISDYLKQHDHEHVCDDLFRMFGSRYFDPNTGALLDDWNNPMRLQVVGPGHYVFVSMGPNGEFENGKGDDYTFPCCVDSWLNSNSRGDSVDTAQ